MGVFFFEIPFKIVLSPQKIVKGMKKVLVPLADGFEEIEAITIIDVLRRAGIEVATLSIDNSLNVTGSHNITVVANASLNEIEAVNADAIILPGGMPGASNLDGCTELKTLICDMHTRNKLLGAICAAPLVLGKMGLLKGMHATCYPGFEKYLEGAYLSKAKVVSDGKIITAMGAGAALEFALKIVDLLSGEEVAKTLAKKMIA